MICCPFVLLTETAVSDWLPFLSETSCRSGGHEIWWTVDAESEQEALGLLPYYVAERTTITRVSEVRIP